MNKVINKFLDFMKLGDDDFDDDYLDDDFEDDEEEYEEKKPAKSSFMKKSSNSRYDDDDDYEEPSYKSSYNKSSNNKITHIRQSSTAKPSSSMGVCVIKPTSIEDGREICETLLDNRTVILNLEGLDLAIAQRIIDFTSGSTYAMKGNLQKISSYIFLVTPDNVDISGDLQDLLGNSFDVASMRSRF